MIKKQKITKYKLMVPLPGIPYVKEQALYGNAKKGVVTYTLQIDHPFDHKYFYTINCYAPGITYVSLLKFIHESFVKSYKKDKDYFHSIKDLAIEEIRINHTTKKITLDIGS